MRTSGTLKAPPRSVSIWPTSSLNFASSISILLLVPSGQTTAAAHDGAEMFVTAEFSFARSLTESINRQWRRAARI